MNISVKSSYALHAIFDLATQPPDQPVKIADIARRQEIPQKFLELILASLKQGGFVESRRGAEGGYKLAKPPDQLTVGQVLRFVEQARSTKAEPSDPFADLWKRVDSAMDALLDSTTFAELVRRWKEA
jgi:Rrf2 family transcriptional regulator, cysteine metabolism repressor